MYVELHCHSNFSLLDGASHPAELVERAAALGMPALALTDHDAIYGAVAFAVAAQAAGVRPIFGAEMSLADGTHLTLLVENETGWHNLCYLISQARHAAPKGSASLEPAELVGCTQGLIALSGCRLGAVPGALRAGDRPAALAAARAYRDLFGRDNFWIELQRHYRPEETWLLPRLTALAGYLGLGCVATNNVHYATPDRHRLQDVLVAVRHNQTLDETVQERRPNSEFYLKPPAAMAALFAEEPEALANSLRLADRCQFQLNYGLQDLPEFTTPDGMSATAYLRRRCAQALQQRYGDPPERARTQLAHELAIIEKAGLANYFLIVGNIIQFARAEGIRCQGRGSAANSLVAYLLHISPIDPLAHDLVFERFLSAERQTVPDIDIDFDAARREEVIQYLYQRYGAAHTAMACTFVTYRRRSALRDVGKALDLSPTVIAATEAATSAADGADGTVDLAGAASEEAAGDDDTVDIATFLELCQQIQRFPRHLGIHSGGMLLSGRPLMSRLPTEPATMADRVVVQWDKDALEEAGLVKIDILGLRMLTAVGDAAALVARHGGETVDLDALRPTDPGVYDMISAGDTMGVFQVESRAQSQLQPRLRPREFNDLIVAISLIRPGPIQGNMVHPYLRRRAGTEPVTYAHPSLEAALAETLGVILFQEQVLKVARDLAGFTAGQGEQLRRALGAKNRAERLDALQRDFLAGAARAGVPAETAAAVFEQLRAFGGYAFPKSHAAAFAVIVYQSAWLKKHHPAAFFTALLNNQPMGFWTPAVLVNRARQLGLEVRPVDIHHSRLLCDLEEAAIRLGFNYVKGLGEAAAAAMTTARERAPFADLADFCRRVPLPQRLVAQLITAGAMDGWGTARRQLLWQLSEQAATNKLALGWPAPPALPDLSETEAMLLEQSVLGLSTGDHIMTLYRDWLTAQQIPGRADLGPYPDGAHLRYAGLVVVHQAPPTAKGFHFITLEDEDGLLDVVVRPQVYEQYRETWHRARILLVGGTLQREGAVVNLRAEWGRALPAIP